MLRQTDAPDRRIGALVSGMRRRVCVAQSRQGVGGMTERPPSVVPLIVAGIVVIALVAGVLSLYGQTPEDRLGLAIGAGLSVVFVWPRIFRSDNESANWLWFVGLAIAGFAILVWKGGA